MLKKDLVFEIGTEEIPAKFMNKSLEQLKSIAENKFKENRIGYGKINVFGTPRRLTLYVEEMLDKQEDLEIMIKGPSKKAAFDLDGNPTKALLGFLKGNRLELRETFIQELSGVDYVYAKKFEKGKNTIDVLKELIPQILTSINFPKSMKWGNKSFRFVRPVRWLMPIFGDELVSFEKDGIPCSKNTKGHRVLSKGDIEVNSAHEYFDKLRNGFVIVDQDERREIIKRQCDEIAKKIDGVILADEELLEEVLYLVEYPTAFSGSFEKEFLTLPKEAVITPMKEHQRYFPVEDKNGKLMNCFIAVRNGDDNFINVVKEGNEKVLRARLSDARFFFEEDKKVALDDCVVKLKHVVFQETLGTIYDKTENIRSLSAYLAKVLQLSSSDKEHLDRAAYLCKADLVTNMVKEFDELQGVMGREYALIQGESTPVADALMEHYMPRFAGDDVPASLIGSILSISDKIDTITGCFSIGIQPTGSQDPYALRRQAIGIISIALEKGLHISLKDMFNRALEPFIKKNILKYEKEKIIGELTEFFKGRLKNVFLEKGYDYDVVDAVLKAGLEDIYDAYLRVNELSQWKKKEDFLSIISSFNRVSNLASKCEQISISKELIKEPEEKSLMEAYEKTEREFLMAIEQKNYNGALNSLIALRTPIDAFFDKIMVMVDDDRIRNNRLSILKSITQMMNIFADLNAIVINR